MTFKSQLNSEIVRSELLKHSSRLNYRHNLYAFKKVGDIYLTSLAYSNFQLYIF